MSTMFKLGWGSISEHKVNKMSDKSIWYMAKRFKSGEMFENRELLKTNDHEWFCNKQDAIDSLINRLSLDITNCESALESKKSILKTAIKEYK